MNRREMAGKSNNDIISQTSPRFWLTTIVSLLLTSSSWGFVIRPPLPPRLTLLFGKRGRMSMAEKRAQRSRKQRAKPDLSTLPPSKLDFKSQPAAPRPSVDAKDIVEQQQANDDKQETLTAAQRLVQSQRESVDMLTAVKEAVEKHLTTTAETMHQALATTGYYAVDNFLDGNERFLDQLQAEGLRLLDAGNMTQDILNLGSGEYIASVTGGNDQYQVCPRSIEWVVATTKHFATSSSSDDGVPPLSNQNCMATMRTFDRQAWQAALDLLTTGDVKADQREFATVVEDATSDQRRISMRYYLVPTDWHEKGGGGGGTTFADGTTFQAQRDRLVIWDSVRARVRNDLWKGAEGNERASCLELHLVTAA